MSAPKSSHSLVKIDFEIFNSRYYSVSKFLLKFFGLWPDLSRARKNASMFSYTVILYSLIIPIIAGMFKAWNKSIVEVAENVVGTLYFSVSYAKFVSAYLFEDRMKSVYIQTANDWESLTDKTEIEILHRHTNEGRLLTILYTCYCIFAIVVFNSFPFIPFILDTVFPLNGSRNRVYPYHPYYHIIDADKYYYELFVCHGAVVVIISTSAIIAIDGMMIVNVKHACGLFAIVCHRLENIGKLKDDGRNGVFRTVDKSEVLESIRGVCEMHRNSLKSVEKIENTFTMSFLFVTVAGLVGIAMLMFDALYTQDDIVKFFIIISLLLGVDIGIFFMNFIVQKIMDSSEEVFRSARESEDIANECYNDQYFSDWYNLCTEAQMFILTILQKTMKPSVLSAGSICELNLQHFALVIKTSMSYATVILSMQQSEET